MHEYGTASLSDQRQMNWDIPQISDEPLNLPLVITLEMGDQLFIVGANGSGKSALIQRLVSRNRNKKFRRIAAHRQTWLESGSINLTPKGRRQFHKDIIQQEMQDQSRWRDDYAQQRQSAVLFDLVSKENARARLITHYVGSENMEEAKNIFYESPSLFDQLNELLGIGRLAVTLENSNDEEILARHRDGSAPFSIAQMSDGERNAAIIAATVLTVEPGTMLLIDEPERHLHRSIIEPFLSALFERRKDCSFVVSTHEIALPITNPEARVLMVRSCQWKDNKAMAWDVEILQANVGLPEDLKRTILGSRKRILFIEGDPNSLDFPLYSALFSTISVVSKGSCIDVQRAVSGLRGSQHLHHVEAFGLIDRDNRKEEDVEELAKDGIFALDVYSVESLYYCSDAITAVAQRQAESLGSNADKMTNLARQKALDILNRDELAERMAARRCEGQVRDEILRQIPDWKHIKDKQKIDISFEARYQDELTHFKKLVDKEKLDDLAARYPLRETGAFDAIAKALNLTGREAYERTLISRVQADNGLTQSLKQRIKSLSETLIAEFETSEAPKA